MRVKVDVSLTRSKGVALVLHESRVNSANEVSFTAK